MPLKPERRGRHAFDGRIQIGIRGDDDRILAAHLENRALDPELAGPMLRRAHVDIESHVARAGEGDETRLGVLDQSVSERRAGAGTEVDHSGRQAGFFQSLEKLGRDGRRIAGRLEDHGVAAHHRRRSHAAHDRQREIPRRDHRAHAQRDITQGVAFAGKLHGWFGFGQVQGQASVELQEVDRLAGVGFGFVPVLADLQDHPGIELRLALADDVGCAEQQSGAFLHRHVLPRFERRERSLHGRLHVLDTGFLMHADDFGWPRGVEGPDFLGCAAALAADHQIVLAAQLAADFLDRRAHGVRVRVTFGAEIDNWFVGKRADGHSALSVPPAPPLPAGL